MAVRRGAETHRRGRKTPQRRQQNTKYLLAGMGVLMVLVVVAAIALSRPAANSSQTAAGSVAVTNHPAPPNAESNGRAWGPKDAPIQVIEYVDYECESCGYFARNYEADVVSTFAGSGNVRFEIRNAPFHGEGARNAAEGAYCAAEQNMFWPMHDSLFLNQPAHGASINESFSDVRLNAIAAKLGMDTNAFGQCLSSGKYTQQVEADYNATVAANVTGTPTFIVNGKMYLGPQSVNDFRRIFAEVAPDVTFGL